MINLLFFCFFSSTPPIFSFLFPCNFSEIQATVETIPHESECIEIGYISSVHGFKGEVRVKPTTDFPELRFSKVSQLSYFLFMSDVTWKENDFWLELDAVLPIFLFLSYLPL